MLDSLSLVGAALPATTLPDFTINVNELLPLAAFKLLGKARALLKPKGFKYVWARNTVVQAKFNDGELAYIINNETDISRLASLYASTTVCLPSASTTSTNTTRDRALTACCLNSNSLRSHLDGLKCFIDGMPSTCHIVAITETWLSNDIPDSVVSLPGYNILRNDRNTHGGGVALYVHESCAASIIAASNPAWTGQPGKLEFIFCRLQTKGAGPVFVACVYRPPHAPFNVPEDFSLVLANAMDSYRHKIILGDFNADQLSSSYDACYLRSLMLDLSLQLVDHGVTHVTPTSATWLDLCLIDDCDVVTSIGKSPTPLAAGHHLITVTLQLPIAAPSPKVIWTRNLSRLKLLDATEDFASLLPSVQSLCLPACSTDVATAAFCGGFIDIVDIYAPRRQLTVNSLKLPP